MLKLSVHAYARLAPAAAWPVANQAPHPISLDELDGAYRIKILTKETGVHALPAETLAGLLAQPTSLIAEWIALGRLSLSCQGQPVTYIPETGGTTLRFYAEKHRNNYTDENAYWLVCGSNNPPASIDGCAAVPIPGTHYLASHPEERDLLEVFTITDNPQEDFWFWQKLNAGLSLFDTAKLPFVLDHLVGAPELQGRLSLRLYGGNVSPHAVQAQINDLVLGQWTVKPRYVVLVGNGTYDYRNLKQQNDNFLPPAMVMTPFGLATSDIVFGDVNGDGLPEVAIGRLPVTSVPELRQLVAKIIAYESSAPPPIPDALLLADAAQPMSPYDSSSSGGIKPPLN